MRRAVVALRALGGLALLLVGCGGDEAAAPTTTRVTVTLGEPLPVGAAYQDPSGNVTLTVRGIRLTGGLLLADSAEACARRAAPALPVQPNAWQLRLEGREQTVPPVTRTSRTVPPGRRGPRPPRWRRACASRARSPSGCPPQADPAEVLFTQLPAPVAWTIGG